MNTLLADGNSLYARSYFAAVHSGYGEVKALHFALRTLLDLLNAHNTQRLGVRVGATLFGWDQKRNADKKRDEKPPEYHSSKEVFQELLTALFGAAHAGHDKYEADDIIATAVAQKRPEDRAYIISGDKDLMQLAGQPGVFYYSLTEKALLSTQFIINRWKVQHPEQIALALAIIGDPVDAIPGVPKWGKKKCQKLFEAMPKGLDLEEAARWIDIKIPVEVRDAFWASLDRTLLRTDIPGVPEPAPLVLADPSLLEDLGLDELLPAYDRLFHGEDCGVDDRWK